MQVDSKKELEKLLKVTCEVFIMSVTKSTVEPMLSFITKVTAVRARSKYSSQPTTNISQAPKVKLLREQVMLLHLCDSSTRVPFPMLAHPAHIIRTQDISKGQKSCSQIGLL